MFQVGDRVRVKQPHECAGHWGTIEHIGTSRRHSGQTRYYVGFDAMHLNDEPVPGLWLNADQIEYLGDRGDEAH